jgi:hypothetical protein
VGRVPWPRWAACAARRPSRRPRRYCAEKAEEPISYAADGPMSQMQELYALLGITAWCQRIYHHKYKIFFTSIVYHYMSRFFAEQNSNFDH